MNGAKDLVAGNPVSGEFLVLKSSLGTTKKGAPFLSFDVRALDGTIFEGCKKWDTNDTIHGVVHVSGVLEEFNGKLQIKATEISPGTKKPEDFVSNPFNLDESSLKSELEILIDQIKDDRIEAALVQFQSYWDTHTFPSLNECPARIGIAHGSTVGHHGYAHGYLRHITEVASLAHSNGEMLECNQRELDMLIFGSIVHDIGKLDGYKIEGGVCSYSETSKFYGNSSNAHLYIGSQMLAISYRDGLTVSEQEFLVLQNIILSHHGPYGDVKPVTKVAHLVHLADMVSSKVDQIELDLLSSPGKKEVLGRFKDLIFDISDYPVV